VASLILLSTAPYFRLTAMLGSVSCVSSRSAHGKFSPPHLLPHEPKSQKSRNRKSATANPLKLSIFKNLKLRKSRRRCLFPDFKIERDHPGEREGLPGKSPVSRKISISNTTTVVPFFHAKNARGAKFGSQNPLFSIFLACFAALREILFPFSLRIFTKMPELRL